MYGNYLLGYTDAFIVFQVADLNGKDAIHIICSLECDEKDELLLDLSRAFLSQQLCRGDMYYLW